MKYISIIKVTVLFLMLSHGHAQQRDSATIEDALGKFGFIENRVISEGDTITYYLKARREKPDKLVVFIQGTDPFPIFFSKMMEGVPTPVRMFNDDYASLGPEYAYAIVAKPGLDGIFKRENFEIPKAYNEKNYQEYRVWQINLSINDIVKNHFGNSCQTDPCNPAKVTH